MGNHQTKPTLADILAAFSEMGDFDKRGLTLALGVSDPQFKRWEEALAAKRPVHLNNDTRRAITSLCEPERDTRLDGIVWALSQANAAVQDLELAVAVRQALRARLMGTAIALGVPVEFNAPDAEALDEADEVLGKVLPNTMASEKHTTKG